MALKKKHSPAARASAMLKAISSAENNAMQAVSGWGKTTRKALNITEKNLAAASKKASLLKERAGKSLIRMQKARAKQMKSIARDARSLALAELATARATLKSAREHHAVTRAAHKVFQLVESGVVSGMQAAENAVAKARRPKSRLRRRFGK